MLHDFIWFFTAGRFEPAWVQAVSSTAVFIATTATLGVLIWYAWDTHSLAKSSKRSADAAMAGSQAALSQIQLLIDKERARIFVVPSEGAATMITDASGDGTGRQKVTFFNVGPTPAINLVVRYNAIATTFETEPQTRNDVHYRATVPEVIAANSEEHAWLNIDGARGNESVIHIHLWGEVTYNDVISTDQRSTRFRFRLTMKRGQYGAMEFDGTWRQLGSAEDNRAT